MPRYETAKDRRNEKRFAALLESKGWEVQLLPDYYPFDLFARRDREQGFVEYKRRNHAFGTFKTAYFPAQKFATCRSWARELGLPFYIFMEWDDQIRYCDAMVINHTITIAGRKDRQKRSQCEPMVELNIHDFTGFFCDHMVTTRNN